MGGFLEVFSKSRRLQIATPIAILVVVAIVAVAIFMPGNSADATVALEGNQESGPP